jgi:hypothetical protein
MDPYQGIDLHDRPGVPMEQTSETAFVAVQAMAHQEPRFEMLKEPSRAELSVVYGSGPAPRGVSGALGRIAYGLPDYRVRRWLLLLVADRVDAVEHGFSRRRAT